MTEGIQQVFKTELDGIYSTEVEKLGTIRTDSTGKIYKFIVYEAATAAVAGVAGEMTAYHGDDGVDDSMVTSDYSDTDNVPAGVLQASLTDGAYGWIQIKGYATMSIAFTAGSDGDVMTLVGAGDGTVDVKVTGAITPDCGIAVDVSLKKILLDCPF